MLFHVVYTGSTYCGPTSLAALTGMDTRRICAAIRHKYPHKKQVKGLSQSAAKWFLTECKLNLTHVKGGGTLKTWCHENLRRDVSYLVNVTNHFVVIRNDQIVCTSTSGRPAPLDSSKYLGSRVCDAWRVEGTPNLRHVERTLAEIRKAGAPKESREARERRELNRYKKQFGLDVEIDRHDGLETIWCYWPDDMVETFFKGVDPFDDSHAACDRGELNWKIRGVIEEFPDLATYVRTSQTVEQQVS